MAANPPDSLLAYGKSILVQSPDGQMTGGLAEAQASANNQSEVEDVLDALLPKREWVEPSGTWMQRVSRERASRDNIMQLQESMDETLFTKQARDTGICPIREETHSQVFDELVRQVTIHCQERGLLLLRVRDEIRMTISAYQALHRTSTAFGVKKTLQAEACTVELDGRLQGLQAERRQLLVAKKEAENRRTTLAEEYAKVLDGQRERWQAEITFLKEQNRNLEQRELERDAQAAEQMAEEEQAAAQVEATKKAQVKA